MVTFCGHLDQQRMECDDIILLTSNGFFLFKLIQLLKHKWLRMHLIAMLKLKFAISHCIYIWE